MGFKNEYDNAGNVYTLGSVDFGGGNIRSVLIKYNSSGTLLWTYYVTLGTSNTPVDLFAKSGGNIYVLSDNVISGQHDAVVSVINTSGTLINQYTYNSGYQDTPVNFEYRSGKILLGVSTNNMGSLTSTTLQLTSGLGVSWTKTFSGTDNYDLKSVKYDNSGNAISLLSVGTTKKQAFVNKTGSTGSNLWDLALDTGNNIKKDRSLFIDDSNNVITSYSHNTDDEISTTLISSSGEKLWDKYYYGN
jgi:hypothetical protein